jgi:hypothetical protein
MPVALLFTYSFLAYVAIGSGLACVLTHRALRAAASRPVPADARTAVGIGTVRSVAEPITVDVESVSGQRFVGRLRHGADEPEMADLRPGVVLLVAFDPAARERLSLADDMLAVRSAFDQMLVHKGLVTPGQLELIRSGTRSRALVTAMRVTGAVREDYREVELDLMVRRPEGGQFPAHETALVPASALQEISPGSEIDAYYRRDDESMVAVCVPPG